MFTKTDEKVKAAIKTVEENDPRRWKLMSADYLIREGGKRDGRGENSWV